MNPLKKHYQEDLSAIELHGLTFKVRLPTLDNKRFQRAVMSRVAVQNEDGDFTTDGITIERMADAQIEAFVTTCIAEVIGWDDFTPESLLLETPEAAEELFDKAGELAVKANAEAEESAGKSLGGLSGQTDGVASMSSMPSSAALAG